MNLRLLIFGINYAPEPTGTGVVTTSAAEALSALGWDVEVVTGVPHYPSWRRGVVPADPARQSVRVRRHRHYVPRTHSALRRGAYEASWFASALPDALRTGSPDLALGIVPSLGGAALAATAAARHRVPLALLFFDVMGRAAEQSGVPGGSRVAASVRQAELALARRAAVVGVIADGFRSYFVEGGVDPERITRVQMPRPLDGDGERRENGTSCHGMDARTDRAHVRARLGWPPDRFVALYSGSIGYKQALETVVEAAQLAGRDPAGVHFVLQGDGNCRRELETRARRLGLQNLEFRPLASSTELPEVLGAADVLLMHQRATVRNMSFASKLGTYLASGTPVVAGLAEDDAVAVEIEGRSLGVLVPPESPAALLDAIVALRTDRRRADELSAAGVAYAQRELALESAVASVEDFLLRAAAPTALRIGVHTARRDILLSNGFSRSQLIIVAGELEQRGRLARLITGVYPTALLRRAMATVTLARVPQLARIADRAEPLSDKRVQSLWSAELFERAALPVLGRSKGAHDLICVAAMRLYGRSAAHGVRTAPHSTSLYHYRAGFGHRSLDEARARGLALLCDHSIAHPDVVEYLVEHGGRLPELGAVVRVSRFWKSVAADIERADAVVVNSSFVRETFIRAGWPSAKVHVVYLGIDDAFLDALSPRRFQASDPVRLLFAGLFDRRKGADDLVPALESVEGPRWRLDIAGPIDGDARRRHSAFLGRPDVRVHGALRRRDLARLMSDSDVFVFPSRAEGSARVVFEALAAGCLVVTTPNAGSIVEDGVHGSLVPPGDAGALADALESVLAEPARIGAVGERNRAVVATSYRQANYVDELQRVYAAVLEARP